LGARGPGDLGGAVVFLASDASCYLTGQVSYGDGGYLADRDWGSTVVDTRQLVTQFPRASHEGA